MDTNTTVDRNMRLQGKRSRWPEVLAVIILLALAVLFVISRVNHTNFLGINGTASSGTSLFGK